MIDYFEFFVLVLFVEFLGACVEIGCKSHFGRFSWLLRLLYALDILGPSMCCNRGLQPWIGPAFCPQSRPIMMEFGSVFYGLDNVK